MSKLGDLDTTGRTIDGPAADLVECVNSKGLKFTAIQYHDEHRGHPDVLDRVENCMDFLRNPGVDDIVPLTEHIEDEGALLYPTGSGWSVAEIVRILADVGEVGGVRAGLELAFRASQSLMEAAEAGEKAELYNHGNVNPWTLFVKPDGTVRVIGYGFPQVEIFAFLDDESEMPQEDSFRYCPPERLEGEEEDISTDLFALSLVAVELMIGRPVYDGLASDLHQQAVRAEGSYRLYKWRDQLPETVRDVLSRAIKYDLDARHHDPLDYVYGVHDILGSLDAEGMSLAEVISIVRRETATGDAPITGGATTMLTKEELQRLAGDLEEVEAAPLDAPRRPRPSDEPEEEEEDEEPSRWGSVKRGGGRRGRRGKGEDAEDKPKDKPAERKPGDDRRDRLRSRLGRSGSKDDGDGDKKRDLRSRLKGGRGRDSGADKGSDKRDALKRRLRRSRDDEDDGDDKGDTKSSKRDSLRDRLRRSGDGPPSRSGRDSKKDQLKNRLRRSRDDDDDEDDDDGEDLDDAAALLARLRSSIGGSSSSGDNAADAEDVDDEESEAPDDDADDDESEEVDDEPSVDEPAAESASEEDADDESEEVDDDESEGLDDDDESEEVDDEPTSDEDVEDDATSDEDVEDEATSDEVDDEEDVEDDATADEHSERLPAAAATGGDGVAFDVQLNGHSTRAHLRGGDTIADAASQLIAQLGGVPTDLTGQLTGWYRIEQGGKLLGGGEPVSALDSGDKLVLSFVRNDVVRVTFEVEGLDTPMRFSAPVGTAVPAGSLIQHLSHWLKLPSKDWRLYVGDKLLGPAQILAEFGPKDEIVVVVRK